MTASDQKTLTLTLTADKAITITAEIDLTGDGCWATYGSFEAKPGSEATHIFPDDFHANWIRFTTNEPCTVTVQLEYR